jgi:hypothetical protein
MNQDTKNYYTELIYATTQSKEVEHMSQTQLRIKLAFIIAAIFREGEQAGKNKAVLEIQNTLNNLSK